MAENDTPNTSFLNGRSAHSDGSIRARWRAARERMKDPGTRPVTLFLATLAVLLLAGLGYWISFAASIPSVADLRDIRAVEATIVFTSDGELLTRYHDKNRTWVSLDSISTHAVTALIATEDHRFYDHWGIDIRRTFSSLWKTAQGDTQGGSTITMQLARNAFDEIGTDPAVIRKMKEYITALQIETLYSKNEILEMYLNSVPFMYGTFGIEAAARTYFQKAAEDLDLMESATLIGMLKGTVMYNPVRNPEASHERRNVVFDQMVRRGFLEAAEADEMRDEPTELDFRRMTHEENLAPYFAEYLRSWLDDWADRRGYNLYLDGLRVHTTIDSGLQQEAEEAVQSMGRDLQAVADVEWSSRNSRYFSSQARSYRSFVENVDPFAYFWQSNQDLLDRLIRRSPRFERMTAGDIPPDSAYARIAADPAIVDSIKSTFTRLEAGLVAIDPRTGHVKAWVGGRDYTRVKYDHVGMSKRQPGSTFKPFVYAAALDYGFSPNDMLEDEVVEYVDPQTGRSWAPRNVGMASGEPIALRDALAYSKNTVTAQLMAQLGADRVADYAHRMGIESELIRYPSLGLGTSEVTLLELVSAYGTIASGGTRREPVFVTRIEDRHGRTLATFAAESQGGLSPHTAYTLLDMMRGVVDYGTGQRIRSVFGANGDVAAKTGTSQNGADGWFVLMHPQLVTGAWVGFTSPSVTFRSNYWGQGAHNALYVVGDFFRGASLPRDASFSAPPGYREPTASRFTYADMDYDSLGSLLDLDSLAWGDYDTLSWRDVDDLVLDDEDEDRDEMDIEFDEDGLTSDTSAAAGGPETVPEDELTEADQLTRQEREQSNVGRLLDEIREDEND